MAKKRYLPKAHWRGNVYARRIETDDDGQWIIVTKITGGNPHATCSQVATRSVPRGYKRDYSAGCRYVGIAYPGGRGMPIFEHDGHAVKIRIRRHGQ